MTDQKRNPAEATGGVHDRNATAAVVDPMLSRGGDVHGSHS